MSKTSTITESLAAVDRLLLGKSPLMVQLRQLIAQVAASQSRVLILGETGTGKGQVASALHAASHLCHKPMHVFSCSEVPATLLESALFGHKQGAFTGAVADHAGVFARADGATLFLDEVGELPLDMQVKLLRVVQQGEFVPLGGSEVQHTDVRLLAATHRDLATMVQRGQFRQDLYFRLNVVQIQVPPLRERGEDVLLLGRHYLHSLCLKRGLVPGELGRTACQRLMAYPWPGNVRQLENVMERALLLAPQPPLGKPVVIQDFPLMEGETAGPHPVPGAGGQAQGSAEEFSISSGIVSWRQFQDQAGKAYLEFVLAKCDGNVSKAARILGTERAYLHRLLRKLAVQVHRSA